MVVAAALFLLGAAYGPFRPARAAMDMFLKIDDIKGESTDDKHKDEIEVLSWSWGMDRTGSTYPGGGGGAGVVSFRDMAFTKSMDRSSPLLFLRTADGKMLHEATLTLRHTGANPLEFFRVTMGEVLVTSFALSADARGASPRPLETLVLYPSKLTFFYTPDGSGIEPPRVTNPGPRTNAEGDSVSLQIVATSHVPLTYGATNLPPGLSIDPATGLIGGTIQFGAAGTYTVVVTATDGGGLQGSAGFLWTVTHTNRVPALTGPGDRAGLEGDVVSLQVTASDPDGDPLGYVAQGLPAVLSIDAATGLISGTIAAGAAGTYPATVTVTDPGLLAASASFNWTVTLGLPRIAGVVASKGWASPGVLYLDVAFTNSGTGHARNLVLKTVVPRTLMGTGAVTYNTLLSPPLPFTVGNLNVGASTTVRFHLNVPATVNRFSVTEGGSVQNVRGAAFNFSIGQAVIP
jgi:type VI secretion system Hcp family effector